MIFTDRRQAGKVLADKLACYAERDDVIVFGLPPGGIPIAFEVAQALGAPLAAFEAREQGNFDVRGRVAILVDDGLATGANMLAATSALRRLGPSRIVAAVPVGSPEGCGHLQGHVDEVVCAQMPETFYRVNLWYQDFSQTPDAEIRALLSAAQAPPAGGSGSISPASLR